MRRSVRLPRRLITLAYHDVVGPLTAAASAESDAVSQGAGPQMSGYELPGAALYKLTSEMFASHLHTVAASGHAPVAVVELDRRSAEIDAVMLTFDDGGSSAYATIAPMLEERGWRGQFFVATDVIGQPGFVTGAELRDLHRRGHVIGSHSCSHPRRMSSLPDAELRYEWEHSVAVLSELLGERVRSASLPNGYYTTRVGQAAAAAGLRWLFTSEPTVGAVSIDGCTILGRFNVQASMAASEIAELLAKRSTARMRQGLMWNSKKLAKRVLGERYLTLRDRLLMGRD